MRRMPVPSRLSVPPVARARARSRRLWRAALLLIAGCLLAQPPLRAADPQTYTVHLTPTGNAALDAALRGSSRLEALRRIAPVGPFGLVSRAREDLGRLRTALDSFGYYKGQVAIRIAGDPLDDPALPERLAALPRGRDAPVDITISPGPLFHLRRVLIVGRLPAAARGKLGLKPGDPAVAADVLAAGARLLSALQDAGYAFAKVPPPVADEIPAADALDVTFTVSTGPRVDIGAITLAGLRHVNPAFVRRRLLVHSGERYDPAKIEAARQDLAALGVFSDVEARAGAAADAEGRIPLTFDMQERLRHTIGLTAAYSTDLGASLGVTWTDRNVFGNAEQLTLSATAIGIGGNATEGFGYDVNAQFLKPDFLRRDQQLELDVAALKQHLIAYDQTAVTAGVTVKRKLSQFWTGSIGVSAEQERIAQEGVTRDYTLLALPLAAQYDSTELGNPLADPTHGLRAALDATPTQSLSHGGASFVILQAIASTYFDFARLGLTRPGRSVLALRATLGSAEGASTFELPPDQRFYAGGSATVRGFKYQSVGPLFPDGTPIGGAAIDAGTIEFRQRVWGPIGAAAFVDAGQVNANSAPFGGTLRVGTGAGIRYYTPIGPVRLDIAFPVNRPPGGDQFELYIGLGQAF